LIRVIASSTARAALMSNVLGSPLARSNLWWLRLIFASRPRGVELRFNSPPKSQGTLAQAGAWPKLDRGLARRGRSATF
jgi:hypothetical protein